MDHTPEIVFKPVESPEDWEAAKAIRQEVFIYEQACPPEEEWDAYDASAHHVLGWVEGKAVATARWREVQEEGEPAAKVERFSVLQNYRGRGYGRELVKHVLDEVKKAGYSTIVLHAQSHLEPFYSSFGFERVSDIFWEAGIPHVKMRLDVGNLEKKQGVT